MEENNPKPKEEEEEQYPGFVKIGELYLGSTKIRCDNLVTLIVGLLKNKDVQTYLQIVEKKKNFGGYVG